MNSSSTSPPHTWLQRLRERCRKNASLLGILAFFLGVGILVLLTCPPLWRDHDGLIQISNRPNDMVILQYPAAYPLFSRLHVYAAQIVDDRWHHHKTKIQFRKAVHLNDTGVHALMWTQMLGLAIALTAFVKNGARGLGARWFMALLLASNASLFIMANLVSTEALSTVLVIALAALGLRIFEAKAWPVGGLIAYTLLLYVTLMTRHANAIFAMLLPTACILYFLVDWARTRRMAAGPWLRAGLFVVLGVICIGASKVTTWLLARGFDVPYRSVSARATVERLGFVKDMTPEEQAAFLAGLQARTDDPVIKEAIPRLARYATWVQQREVLLQILRPQFPDLAEELLRVKAEADMDRIATLFYQTHDRHLLAATWQSIWRTLATTTAADVAAFYLNTGAESIDLYASDPDYSKKTQGLRVCSPEAQRRIKAWEGSLWTQLWRWAPHGAILLASSMLALALLLFRTGDPARLTFALALAITGVTATCLTYLLVNYNPRFTSVADLFASVTLALVAGQWVDAIRSRHAPAEDNSQKHNRGDRI